MMVLSGILALMCGVAGWYYAFYSTAAGALAGVESAGVNRARIKLRRINGMLMILLGVTLYLLTSSLEQKWSAILSVVLLGSSLLLLLVVGLLAILDLKLTRRLREALQDRRPGGPMP